MSRSEKNAWWHGRWEVTDPSYTGECGCKYCTRTKAWIKRQDNKAERRKGKAEINRQVMHDLHPAYIQNAGSMTYGQDTAA